MTTLKPIIESSEELKDESLKKLMWLK